MPAATMEANPDRSSEPLVPGGICHARANLAKKPEKMATWQRATSDLPANLQPEKGKQPAEIMEITTKLQGGER